ncbi:ABC-2 family transporter protein [Bifidobacterium lemurum]|uniref:ABC-2 family transporter protein n=1 Tax=Bifidobacterium lemurum TaxID=1603886 RepID=A0A261FT71_9BIFI|nr:hypothetical protein [Bifidobacterium lemurum]OZG62288.1 ABC-2 family transporter protein [Bifidobacterium lemurum]QOL33655.1 hypothetical protein BL8807_07600 [Bifidobacterium lemurum]
MINLFKSDMYRLIHGRKLWMMTALIAAMNIGLTALSFYMVRHVEGEFDADTAMFATMRFDSHVMMLSELGITTTTLSFLTLVFAVLVVNEDFETGFVNNLAAGRHMGGYYVGKLLTLAALTVWHTMVYIVSAEIGFAILGFRYDQREDWGVYFAFVGLVMLGVFAMATVVAFVTWLSRNRVVGVFAAIAVQPMGPVDMVMTTAAQMLDKPDSPWFQTVLEWMPSYNFSQLAATATIGGMPVWLHALIAFAGWVALAGGAAVLVNRRRDVC